MDIASQHHAQADLGALRTAMQRASVILLMLLIVSSAFFMFAVHTNRSVPFFPEHFFRVQTSRWRFCLHPSGSWRPG